MLEFFTIGIAGISLILSIVTLYISHLKKPDLSASAGPKIVAGAHPGYIHFTIPVSIINSSPSTGVIKQMALTITRRNEPEKNYYLNWHGFYKISDDGSTWIHQDVAHSIAIPGHSTVTKSIDFRWFSNSKPKFQLEEGSYIFRIDLWSNGDKPVATLKHELQISQREAKEFQNKIPEEKKQNNNIIYLYLDKDIDVNRLLTKHEVKHLLE